MENQTTDMQSRYWKSVEEWSNDPTFKEQAKNEFLTKSPMEEGPASEVQRRTFLKLMGASLAMGSTACIRRQAQKIVPYANRPKEILPGIANFYASTFVDGTEGFGIVVTTREGRPIKIEGNPSHPLNRGGMSARAHSLVLSLYDPDRLKAPAKKGAKEFTWETADTEVKALIKEGGVSVLTSSSASPTFRKLLGEFSKKTGAKVHKWDAVNAGAIAIAQQISYGEKIVPRLRLDRAKYILSVDADILGTHLSPTEFTKDFAAGRSKIDGEMNKLVVFESLMSLTGSNADERHRIKSSEQLALLKAVLSAVKGESFASVGGVTKEVISHVAKELKANKGQSLVVAGGVETKESLLVQFVVNELNSALGNDGKTVDYKNHYSHMQGSAKDLEILIQSINAGEVKTLIINDCNPVYGALGASFKAALSKVKTVIYTGATKDETGSLATYLLPDHHNMEEWGDAELIKSVYSIQQPTIRPLYNTRSFEQGLLNWMGSESTWFDYLKANWKSNILAGTSWDALLQKGVLDKSKSSRATTSSVRTVSSKAKKWLAEAKLSSSKGYELVLYKTVGLSDGAMANVPWLQEFPDPVTKICWDNYASVSPATAKKEKLSEGDIITLKVENRGDVSVPVHIQPGTHDSVIGLALGYGRKGAGSVADGVGQRATHLGSMQNGISEYAGMAVTFRKEITKTRLANVQGHNSMEGRQIVVEATLKDYQKDPESGIHRHKIFNMYDKHKFPGQKWAMSVDLNSCTGCGACVIACQSENNVPVVGKEFVIQGRLMHWIRTDRYYVGEPDNPDVVYMPVMCQHCDNAPCEAVCPVAATVHSPEGTNDMIYNRCVGTRYCANNCPYKVRRFNWFDFTNIKSPLHMAMNPEVTVRARGVMEKCSFCIHRIKGAQQVMRNEGRKTLREGDITVACQQSCPANAITFGDMNNPESKVSKNFAEKRAYSLLEELNNLPAVRYQTKIRNKSKLKGAHKGHGGGH